VFIVCIRNTARSKSIPLLCTHVDSYKFSTVHPPSVAIAELVLVVQTMVSAPILTKKERKKERNE